MDMNPPSLGDHPFGDDAGDGACCRPLTRAPAVRLKLTRRCIRRSGRRPAARSCVCGRVLAPPVRADKRWRLGGTPCLILRREAVPC